jgi:predicted transcriptional regulator
MAEQDTPPPEVDPLGVVRIVCSYVRRHQIGADQLAGLIVDVHRALASLGRDTPMQEPATPAVPIRRSVQQDHVVCLECGYRARMLRKHLRVAHHLEIADYRARWNLAPDHPVTAPSYSAQRSTMAKQHNFGRKSRTVAARRRTTRTRLSIEIDRRDPATAASPSLPRRRGRRPRGAPAE